MGVLAASRLQHPQRPSRAHTCRRLRRPENWARHGCSSESSTAAVLASSNYRVARAESTSSADVSILMYAAPGPEVKRPPCLSCDASLPGHNRRTAETDTNTAGYGNIDEQRRTPHHDYIDGNNDFAYSIPSDMLARIRAEDARCTMRCTPVPSWECFHPVVVPPEGACLPTFRKGRGRHEGLFLDGAAVHGPDRDGRFTVENIAGRGTSPRGREQASRLAAVLRQMLEKLRSRGGRKQLEAASAAIVHPPELGTSGAQMGLQVMTALEAVVVEEGEIYHRCFSEVVRQARIACKQQGDLVGIMRRHYATLFQDVTGHLSGLRRSLEATVFQEEQLREEAHRIQRLSQILADDARANEYARRRISAAGLTELELYARAHDARNTNTNNAEPGAAEAGGLARRPHTLESRFVDATGKLDEATSVAAPAAASPEAEIATATSTATSMATSTTHTNATMKMELFEEMMEAKAFKNRVEERHEMWRAQNAATTIQDWWRRVNPPEWMEEDRHYAASLLQAHFRGKLTRLRRKRSIERSVAANGATVLQRFIRCYQAVKARSKREREVAALMGPSLNTLDQAIRELEAKLSAHEGDNPLAATIEQAPGDSALGARSKMEATSRPSVYSLVRRLHHVGQLLDVRNSQYARNSTHADGVSRHGRGIADAHRTGRVSHRRVSGDGFSGGPSAAGGGARRGGGLGSGSSAGGGAGGSGAKRSSRLH